MVSAKEAGKKAPCKSCGQRLQVPGTPGRNKTVLGEVPSERGEPINLEPIREPGPAMERAQTSRGNGGDDEPPGRDPEPYRPYRRRPSATSGPLNRTLAGAAATVLLVGLFLPMIHAPMGIWMSFVDLPWKAVTVGFALADAVDDRAADVASDPEPRSNRPRTPPPRQDAPPVKPRTRPSRRSSSSSASWPSSTRSSSSP
jgi:hypothetical protein